MAERHAEVGRAGEGEVLGAEAGCRERFLLDGKDWGGRFAVVEHLLEEMIRAVDTATEGVDLGPVVAPYGCDADMDATWPIVEKYRLTFG